MMSFKVNCLIIFVIALYCIVFSGGLQKNTCTSCLQLETRIKELAATQTITYNNVQGLLKIISKHILDEEKYGRSFKHTL